MKTQKERILEAIETRPGLTHLELTKLLNLPASSKRISELNLELLVSGMEIVNEPIPGTNYGGYFLRKIVGGEKWGEKKAVTTNITGSESEDFGKGCAPDALSGAIISPDTVTNVRPIINGNGKIRTPKSFVSVVRESEKPTKPPALFYNILKCTRAGCLRHYLYNQYEKACHWCNEKTLEKTF